MEDAELPATVKRSLEQMDRALESAPREPGVYRMPCGNCHVEFTIEPNGKHFWLLPGDSTIYSRETISEIGYGDYVWERLYTLDEAEIVLGRG